MIDEVPNVLRRLVSKKVIKAAVVAILGILILFAVYILLLCHPGLFFRHSLTHGAITLYSDEPIPARSAEHVLKAVEQRLARSPLFHPRSTGAIRAYICNRKWRFILFANFRFHVGGLTYPPLSNNIFLRAVDLDADRLIGPSGNAVPGERTLTYFIAHEIVHTLLADELGAVAYWRLPDWKNEGYADHVAKGANFRYGQALGQLRSGDREMDPLKSGLYLRYNLLVAYLLDQKGIGVHEMLDRDFEPAHLEAEMLDGNHES
jgi:hypothetical protein